jgi:hypothetical protein
VLDSKGISQLTHGANEANPDEGDSDPHADRPIAPTGFPWIILDGPHGAPSQQWERYSCVVLVAGGIGVTPMLSVLLDVMYRMRAREAGFHSELRTRHIELAWVSKTLAEASWLKDTVHRLEKADRGLSTMRINLFVTQQSTWSYGVIISQPDGEVMGPMPIEDLPESAAAETAWTSGLLGFERTAIHMHRPDFQRFLRRVQREHANEQSIGVFACGPKTLMKSLAKSVRVINATELGPPLHAFEEHF